MLKRHNHVKKMPQSFFSLYPNPEKKQQLKGNQVINLFNLLCIKYKKDKRTFITDFFHKLESCKGKRAQEERLIKDFIVANF